MNGLRNRLAYRLNLLADWIEDLADRVRPARPTLTFDEQIAAARAHNDIWTEILLRTPYTPHRSLGGLDDFTGGFAASEGLP